MNLPPLPEEYGRFDVDGSAANGFIESRMREYGALCRREALEEAAKVCEDRINWGEAGVMLCLKAIRELLK